MEPVIIRYFWINWAILLKSVPKPADRKVVTLVTKVVTLVTKAVTLSHPNHPLTLL